jgi:chitinase
LKELKARFPDLRVLISLGGWTWSGRFSDAALTAQSRATFVTSCIDLFIRGQFAAGITEPGIFDGIDVDWEWPGAPGATNNYRPEDTANFTALLREFRSQLDARGTLDGRTYLLTIAAPAGEANIGKIDVAGIAPYVDGVNLMSYDFRGGWSATTGHQAALHQPAGDPLPAERWWIDNAVELWTNGGFPASKLTVGMPFYGRGWTGVSAGPAGDGLWQTTTGAAPGTYEAGIEDADVLAQLPSSYVRYHDAAAGASWLYDPTARVFWTWDDASSLGVKAAYIREKGLAGAMVWELSGDDASGTLLRSLTDALNR